MDEVSDADLNNAIAAAIEDTAIPHVDRDKIFQLYDHGRAAELADKVLMLVREAAAMPITWGDMTLAEGVQDILRRFSELHPELTPEALAEIGRCVGWQLR